MLNRILALALCLVLAVGMIPAADAFGREPIHKTVDRCCHTVRVDTLSPNYTRPAYDGTLIGITPERVRLNFEYLDKIYVQEHPEAALAINTGSFEDREVLLTLAQTITAGCTTNKAKADAIDDWMRRNIVYEINASAYASDTFYDREGNCLSYANLMAYMLRLLEIPAVVGDGWRGDMKTETVDLFNYAGHAWVFVRLDDEWVLYDPLWIDGGTTDRDYMAEWIYMDCVEFVTPAADGDHLPPEPWDKSRIYYTDGRFFNYSDFLPTGVGNHTLIVNNMPMNFTACQDDMAVTGDGSSDGIVYLDGRDKEGMVLGELYRDSWISYGDARVGREGALTRAWHNGMQVTGSVDTWNDTLYFMDGFHSYKILAPEDKWSIRYGTFTLPTGYTGKYLSFPWGDNYIDEGDTLTITSQNPEIATVDENNNITTHAEGYCQIEFLLMGSNGGIASRNCLDICVSDEERIPDYTDIQPHDCVWVYSHDVAATCEGWGYEVHICSVCNRETELYTDEPLGHNDSLVTTTPATCTGEGCITRSCSRCGIICAEQSLPVDPNAHVWEEYDCTLCDATRLTLFDDVVAASFYEEPVAWAVEQGITNGTSDTAFGSNSQCLRAHVVTFLWRAAGQPEPVSDLNPFTDVKTTDFYYKAVLWAVEQGITTGTTATTFGPFGVCNRAQVVTFLHRAMGSPAPNSLNLPFSDVPAGAWYAAPIAWAVENGITNGVSATEFGPNSACNRAQVVTFLYRAFGE